MLPTWKSWVTPYSASYKPAWPNGCPCTLGCAVPQAEASKRVKLWVLQQSPRNSSKRGASSITPVHGGCAPESSMVMPAVW